MSQDAQPIVISIKPEPSPEEMAVITAAVAAAVRSLPQASEALAKPVARWARQGRVDAMRGLDRDHD